MFTYVLCVYMYTHTHAYIHINICTYDYDSGRIYASLLIQLYVLEGGYTVRERNKKQVIKQKGWETMLKRLDLYIYVNYTGQYMYK